MKNLQTRLLQRMALAGKLCVFIIALSFITGMVKPRPESTPLMEMPDTNGFHNKISFKIVKELAVSQFENTGKVSGMRTTKN